MELKELLNPNFFKEKILPQVMDMENRKLTETLFKDDHLRGKVLAILYNAYSEYLSNRIEEMGLKGALNETVITLNKYYPEIASYINDFELLKSFIYPPTKPLPAFPNIYFSLLEDEEEIEKKMLRGILLEFFDMPYKFDFHGVCIFTEKDLMETDFIEEWRKEQILNEAKYLTQEIFFNTENSPYKIPAFFFKHKGKYWYIVKYYFPENFYVPNFKAKSGFEKEWQSAFKGKWLGYFTLDVYGKKPSVFNILREEDRLFLENLKRNPDKVIP